MKAPRTRDNENCNGTGGSVSILNLIVTELSDLKQGTA